jgi:predicted short-subunit dehydrogenase-like oxidoreductase (DUF2520 family)
VTAEPTRSIILGRGRVGQSLTAALLDVGLPAVNRSAREPGLTCTDGDDDRDAVVFLAVADDAIADVAASISRQRLPARWAFVHLSGALGLEPVQPLRSAGHAVGSFHPLRPFPAVLAPSAFRGVTVALEASDPGLRTALRDVAGQLGATPREVLGSDRPSYHAAAVIASSFIVVMLERAVRVLGSIGWTAEDALSTLLPLTAGTLENLRDQRLPRAFTGPLTRGDVETVRAHLTCLGRDPALASTRELYATLTIQALGLAGELGVDEGIRDRLAAVVREASAAASNSCEMRQQTYDRPLEVP